jgi:tetratricopeptide (TPR) repeat protein
MPTHIYTRLGDWDGVVKGNLRAADAALMSPAGEKGEFVWDEFPHAIEYLVYAYLQQGKDAAAAEQVKRLHSTQQLEPSFKTAFHLASTQARYALERRDWSEAAAITPRTPTYLEWDLFTWAEATARFARGVGAARVGKLEEVAPTLARLVQLEGVARNGGEDLFARNIKMLNLELTAWAAQAQGQRVRAVQAMREADTLEAATPKHPLTPGPTLPASEQLGDLYLQQANPAAALTAYQSSLKRYPRRFHSLLGAARAASKVGDVQTARRYYDEFLTIAGSGSRKASLDEARQYLITSVAATARSPRQSSE